MRRGCVAPRAARGGAPVPPPPPADAARGRRSGGAGPANPPAPKKTGPRDARGDARGGPHRPVRDEQSYYKALMDTSLKDDDEEDAPEMDAVVKVRGPRLESKPCC